MQSQLVGRLNDLTSKARRLQGLIAEHDLDPQTLVLCRLGVTTVRVAKALDKIIAELEQGLRNRDPKPDAED